MPLHEVKQREAIVGKKLKYRGMLREGRVILTRFRTPWCQPPIDGRKVTSFLAQGGIFSMGIASPAFKEEKGGQNVFLEPAVFQVPLTGNSQNAGWHLVGWCVLVPLGDGGVGLASASDGSPGRGLCSRTRCLVTEWVSHAQATGADGASGRL